jgi:hypothetical protein
MFPLPNLRRIILRSQGRWSITHPSLDSILANNVARDPARDCLLDAFIQKNLLQPRSSSRIVAPSLGLIKRIDSTESHTIEVINKGLNSDQT